MKTIFTCDVRPDGDYDTSTFQDPNSFLDSVACPKLGVFVFRFKNDTALQSSINVSAHVAHVICVHRRLDSKTLRIETRMAGALRKSGVSLAVQVPDDEDEGDAP